MNTFECSALELMLLAFVQRGLTTTYDLLTHAGLSVGATSRALRRLRSAGLLTSTSGKRKSQRFLVTAKGEEESRLCWDYVTHKSGPVSLETALRILYLGWLFGDLSKASEYARWAVTELHHRGIQRKAEAEAIRTHFHDLWPEGKVSGSRGSTLVLASAYRWIRSNADAGVTHAEAEALNAAIEQMQRMARSRNRGNRPG